jgi:hypothetical protein
LHSNAIQRMGTGKDGGGIEKIFRFIQKKRELIFS